MAFRVTQRLGLNNGSDAAFRAWVTAFIDDLVFSGNVVQTDDTGQINLTTATRPTAGTYTHYAVFRFNDSLQTTAPIFFRINFGSGGSVDRMGIQIIFGAGSNGSGTLTNATPAFIFHPNATSSTQTTITYPTYVCSHSGSINVAFNLASGGTSGHGFWYLGIHRVRNLNGDQTGEGLVVQTNSEQRYYQYNGAITAASTNYALSPGSPTYSNIGGQPFVFRHFVGTPQVRPVLEALTVIRAEVPTNTVFDARPISTQPTRTYISLGQGSNNQTAGVVSGGSTNYTLAMLYD